MKINVTHLSRIIAMFMFTILFGIPMLTATVASAAGNDSNISSDGSDGIEKDPAAVPEAPPSALSDHFVMTIDTTRNGASNSVHQFRFTGTDFNIDFNNNGDFLDADEAGHSGFYTHDFGTPGTYTIRVEANSAGGFSGISYDNSGYRLAIIDIVQWGTNPFTDMHQAFYDTNNLVNISAIDNPDFSGVTDFYRMFYSSGIVNLGSGTWDMSGAVTLERMFERAAVFNGGGGIDGWNMPNLTTTHRMFERASAFNAPIGNWNVPNLQSTNLMFYVAANFNQDLCPSGGGWQTTSNLTNTSQMFQHAYRFNGSMNCLETSGVTNMNNMFYEALAFDQDLSGWDTSSVTSMTNMFFDARAFNQDISDWDVSNVTTMHSMFESADVYNQPFCNTAGGNWDTASLNTTQEMFLNSPAFNADMSCFDMADVTTTQQMFQSAPAFNQDISAWNVISVTNMYGMFNAAKGFNQDVSDWDVSNVTNFGLTFRDADAFNQSFCNSGSGGNDWDTGSATDMNNMFAYAGIFNEDVSCFDTADVINLGATFRDTPAFNQDISMWDVSSVIYLNATFYNADAFNQNLCQGGANSWDTGSATTMQEMFAYTALFDEDLSCFDTADVLTMDSMFEATRAFNQDISAWDVSSVTDMDHLFRDADAFNQNLCQSGASDWDTGSATTMQEMFAYTALFDEDLTCFDTTDVTNMNGLFRDTLAFDQDVSMWDVSNVTNMGATFYNADAFVQNLCQGGANDWDTGSVTNMQYMFGHTALFNSDLGCFDTSEVRNMSYMFYLTGAFNQDISVWGDLNKVTDMLGMFQQAQAFDQNFCPATGTQWSTNSLNRTQNMFYIAPVFNQPVDCLDMSDVTIIQYMFRQAAVFNQDLDAWDVGKVTNAHAAFMQTPAFDGDVSTWDVSKITNFSHMFDRAANFDQSLAPWTPVAGTSFVNMLSNSGLSVANYDSTLISWGSQDLINNRTLGSHNLEFCAGEAYRGSLVTDQGWNIQGDALGCAPGGVSGSSVLRYWVTAGSHVGSDNDPVSTWRDISGEGKHFTQTVPINQPTYQTDVDELINFNPVMAFDGSEDFVAGKNFEGVIPSVNVPIITRTASSELVTHPATNSVIGIGSSWRTATNTVTNTIGIDYLQLDLGETVPLSNITTQGDGTHLINYWVTSYTVEVSENGTDYTQIGGTYPGNVNRTTAVTNVFTDTVPARYVRVYPQAFNGWPAMRVAVGTHSYPTLTSYILTVEEGRQDNVTQSFNNTDANNFLHISAADGSGNTTINHTFNGDNSINIAQAAPTIDDKPVFTTLSYNGSAEATLYRNGVEVAEDTTPPTYALLGDTHLGGLPTGQHFDGKIAEANLYSTELTQVERERVDTYFAIKYSIPLDHDLIYEDETPAVQTVWDQTANAAYNNDVFGLGLDNNQGLNQRISTSLDDDDKVLIAATTNDFVSINSAPGRKALSGVSGFVVMGNDDGATTFDIIGAPDKFKKLDREWMAQVTGDDQELFFEFDVAYSTFDIDPTEQTADYYLVKDDNNNGDLSDDQPTILTNTSGDLWSTPTAVTVEDGQRFTLAIAFTAYPGGVGDHLGLWLKADKNGDVTVDGSTIITWTDQSVNNSNAINSGTPTFENDAANQINFNPVVEFDGATDIFSLPDDTLPSGTGDYAVYVVGETSNDSTPYNFLSAGANLTDEGLQLKTSVNGSMAHNWVNNGFSSPTDVIATNQPWLGTFIYDDASGRTIGVDGDQVATNLLTTSNISTTNNVIGQAHGGIQPYLGNIAEVISYDRATTSGIETQQIESYLALKYGITLSGTNYIASTSVSTATQVVEVAADIAASGGDVQLSTISSVSPDIEWVPLTGGAFGITSTQIRIDNQSGGDLTVIITATNTATGETASGSAVRPQDTAGGNAPFNTPLQIPFTTLLPYSAGDLIEFDISFAGPIANGRMRSFNPSPAFGNDGTRSWTAGIGAANPPNLAISIGAPLPVVMWDAAVAGIYSNDIVGIGRDDGSALYQKQSQSVNSDALVTIGAGNMITSTNISNTAAITDGNFLMWGNNNDSISLTAELSGTLLTHIDRTWLVQETGDVGSVKIRIPQAVLSTTTPTLIVSTDATITASDTQIVMADDGNGNYEAMVDFADGSYFTFAANTDETSPDVTINQAAGQADPDTDGTVTFDVVFTEAISVGTFITSDIDTSASTATGITIDSIAEAAPNDGTTFVMTISATGDGTITATIPAGTVADLSGNVSTVSTSTDNSVLIDTTPPADPVMVAPAVDEVVNDPTPIITGTAEAGATITVTINGETLVTTVNVDGIWAVAPTVDLAPDGAYTPTMTIADPYGNVNGPINGNRIYVDTAAPAAPVMLEPAINGVTNDPTPIITGTAEAGATITVTVNGEILTTIVAVNGTWAVTPTVDLAPDGAYTPTLTIEDLGGNVTGPVDGNRFNIDTAAPVNPVMFEPAVDAVTNDPTPIITGTAEAGATVTVTVNGETLVTTVGVDGTWAVTPTVDLAPDGAYTPTMTIADPAGNVTGPINGNRFEIDTTPPANPVMAAPALDEIVTDPRPIITGTAEAGATITVTVNGEELVTTVAIDGTWAVTPTVDLSPDGAYTPTMTIADPHGNVNGPINGNRIYIDTTAPSAPVMLEPAADGITNDPTPIITGTAEAGATITVTVNGETLVTAVAVDGTWAVTPTVNLAPDGAYTPTMTIEDWGGNVTGPVDGNRFNIDTTPPANPAMNAPAVDESVNDATPVIAGTAEAGATITITVNGETLVTTVAVNGTWMVTPTVDLAPDGTFTPTMTITDPAGNVNGPINGNRFEIDTTPPANPVMIAPAIDEVVTDPRPVLTGTAEAGATITVTVNGEELVTTVAIDGTWAVTPTTDLTPDGFFTPTLTVEDRAGNATGPVDGNRIFVDANAPANPVMNTPAVGGVTNNPTPVITGTAEAGATITITVNGETLTTTVAVDGTWAVTPTVDLEPDGTFTPTMTIVDPVGNVNGPIDGNPFTVDTTPPAAPPVDYPVNGGSTNGTVTGSGAEPGNTITVTVQGTGETCSVVVAPDGSWSCNLTPLPADGPITIDATATDLAGNTSPPTTVTATMDSTRPPAPIVDEPVSGGFTNGTITGSDATPGDTITVTVQSTGETCAVIVAADGSWSCDLVPTPAEGPIVLEATATDPTGNTSLPTTIPAVVDSTPPPPPTIITPTNGSPVTGMGEPGATVTVTTPSGSTCSTVVQLDGSWSCTLAPEPVDGEDISANQTDSAGNTSPTTTASSGIDTVAPSAPTIITPTNGSPVTGLGEPGATVTVTTPSGSSCSVVVQPDGTWSCTLEPEPVDGEDISANQTDPAGNTSSTTTVTGIETNDSLLGTTVYLPIIAHGWPEEPTQPLPDLIVESVAVSGEDVVIVVKNIGPAASESGFWLDLIVDPSTVPTQLNDRVESLGSDGLIWGVTGVTLAPGESITIRSNDQYLFDGRFKQYGKNIPDGLTVFAHVDAYHPDTTYGNVLETHEETGDVYNNITQSTSGAADLVSTSLDLTRSAEEFVLGNLPARPNGR